MGPQPGPDRGGQRTQPRRRPRCTSQTAGVLPAPGGAARGPPLGRVGVCASGGGRIDLEVLERRTGSGPPTSSTPSRASTSSAGRPSWWPRSCSAPTSARRSSHTTGGSLPLDYRAATALFGSFGIEWDLIGGERGRARTRLAGWVDRHKRFRPLLHSGRVVRPESSDPAVLLHGGSSADGPRPCSPMSRWTSPPTAGARPCACRLTGPPGTALPGKARSMPFDVSMSPPLPGGTDRSAARSTGHVLRRRGFWMPRCRPETITLFRVRGRVGSGRSQRPSTATVRTDSLRASHFTTDRPARTCR